MEIYLFENIIEKIRAITVLARESLLPTKYYKKHYTFYVYLFISCASCAILHLQISYKYIKILIMYTCIYIKVKCN